METVSRPHEQHCPVLHHCPLKYDPFFSPMVTDDVPLLKRDLDSSSALSSDDKDYSWAFDLCAAALEPSLAMGDAIFGTADTPPTDEYWDSGEPSDIFIDTEASRKASTNEKLGMVSLSEDDQQNEASSDEDEVPPDQISPDKVIPEDTSRIKDLPHQHGYPAASRESSPGENSIHAEDPSKSPADEDPLDPIHEIASEDTSATGEDPPYQDECPAASRESSPGEDSIPHEDPSESLAGEISPANIDSPACCTGGRVEGFCDEPCCDGGTQPAKVLTSGDDDNGDVVFVRSTPITSPRPPMSPPANHNPATLSTPKKRPLPDGSDEEGSCKRAKSVTTCFIRIQTFFLWVDGEPMEFVWEKRRKSWEGECEVSGTTVANNIGAFRGLITVMVWLGGVRPVELEWDGNSEMFKYFDVVDQECLMVDETIVKGLIAQPDESREVCWF